MPRRWGKTLNLDMLRRFLEMPVDKSGIVLNKSETDNHKLFASGQVDGGMRGKVTLPPLHVASARLFDNVHALDLQGTFPVVYIDVKNCKGSNYEDVQELLRAELSSAFRRHCYLKDSSKFTQRQRDLVDQYIEESTEPVISRGLQVLSDALHTHHNKEVWILVDEYDAVANMAYREFSEKDCKQTISLFKGLYEKALKNNPHLAKGVLTGVQYIAKSGMLSGLNNLGKIDFTHAKYAQHYGLDQDEIDLFFSHFNVPADLAAKAKQWYDGYKVPKFDQSKSTTQELEILEKYNVWSIVSYLKEGEFYKFKSYWEQSGSIDFLEVLFKQESVREVVEKLVNGESIHLERKADFSVENFRTLKEVLSGNKTITQHGLDVLFSYLFIGGYLTIDENGANHYRIPNKEITYEMQQRLISYYKTIYTIDPGSM